MRGSCNSASAAARRRRSVGLGTAVVLVGILAVTACGDDDDSAGSSATTGGAATTVASSGAATTEGGATTAPAAGEPIKVMTVAPVNTNLPPYPNIPAAAEVYAQYINDQGGINGRPLEVITCDDQGDPNVGANCARQAVDEGVVAVVGSFVFDASRIIPVLEEANIAWFGECCPLVAQEFSSPISFPLGSLLPGQGAGSGWKMAQDGCKSPVVVVLDIPAADAAVPALINAYEVGGGDPAAVKIVRITAVPQDYSAQVAEATSGTDCIYGGIADSNWAAWLPGMQAAGADQRLYGLQGNLNGKIAEQFPELTNDGIVANSYPNIAGPMWDDYRASLEKYDAPDLDWNSLAGLGTWTAYTAFTDIVSGIDGDVTSDSFIDAANSTSDLDTGGMIPVIDLTQPYTGFGGDFPRIFNRTVFFDVIQDGELVAFDDQSYDMTGPIDALPL